MPRTVFIVQNRICSISFSFSNPISVRIPVNKRASPPFMRIRTEGKATYRKMFFLRVAERLNFLFIHDDLLFASYTQSLCRVSGLGPFRFYSFFAFVTLNRSFFLSTRDLHYSNVERSALVSRAFQIYRKRRISRDTSSPLRMRCPQRIVKPLSVFYALRK